MSRAYLAAEQAGVRAIAVTATAFMGMQRATGKAIGLPDLRIAEYPGVITIDGEETFDRNVRERVFPELMERIREPVKAVVAEAADPAPPSPAPPPMLGDGSPDGSIECPVDWEESAP